MAETALTPQQSFEQNIIDRLRKDIGDLIPDTVLAQMVERSINKLFFEETVIYDNYHRETGRKPTQFSDMVFELMKPRIEGMIKQWAEEHPTIIDDIMRKAITEALPAALGAAAKSVLVNGYRSSGFDIAQLIKEALRNGG